MFRAPAALLLGYLTASLVAAVYIVVLAWGTPGIVAAPGLLLIFPALPLLLFGDTLFLTIPVFLVATTYFWIVFSRSGRGAAEEDDRPITVRMTSTPMASKSLGGGRGVDPDAIQATSASESVKRGVRAIFLAAALVLSAAAVYLGFTESWSISAFFIVVASGLALGAVSMLAPRR